MVHVAPAKKGKRFYGATNVQAGKDSTVHELLDDFMHESEFESTVVARTHTYGTDTTTTEASADACQHLVGPTATCLLFNQRNAKIPTS
jgi:hypothetical protein